MVDSLLSCIFLIHLCTEGDVTKFERIRTSVNCNGKRVTVTHTKYKYFSSKKIVSILTFIFMFFPFSDFSVGFTHIFSPSSNCCAGKFTEDEVSNLKVSQEIADSSSNQPDKHTPTVSKKSEPLMKEANEENLLIKAMKNRNYVKARALIIDVGVGVNFQDKNGSSPLHIASANGSRDMIDLLLDNEASMAVQNNEGNTPLHILAREGYYEIISELGFLNEEDMECIASVKNTKGHTALDLAYASMVNEEYFKNSVFDDLSSMRCSDIAQLE